MYKCCWNCENGFTCCAKPDVEAELNASKRLCLAPYPVSAHMIDPFRQRYCKQFEATDSGPRSGHYITKAEAERLGRMTAKELIEYWEAHR